MGCAHADYQPFFGFAELFSLMVKKRVKSGTKVVRFWYVFEFCEILNVCNYLFCSGFEGTKISIFITYRTFNP